MELQALHVRPPEAANLPNPVPLLFMLPLSFFLPSLLVILSFVFIFETQVRIFPTAWFGAASKKRKQ